MQGRKSQYLRKLQSYDLKKLLKNTKDKQLRLYLIAIKHVQEGKTMCEVGKLFNVHYNSVRSWVERFVNEGMEGLKRRKGQGRRRKLSETEAFKESVLEMQKERSGGSVRGLDILKMMEEKFGVTCCLNSVYVYLQRANLVWITGRSKHPKMNQESQDAFKKTSKRS